MALELDYTDADTGAAYPHAYARVEDAHLTLATNYVDATVAVYYNADTAASGRAPIKTFPVFTLGKDEVTTPNPGFVAALVALVQAGQIQSPKDALTACLYVLLKAHPEFAGAVDV